ncbi:hypothetical protein [Vallitalea okinawensis]|uniref:hypothetical protein n=1 Tax=Vallitalea okinawensis TaxID=2078660 RepID=UPI000CFBA76E|nr:hypothetical protein [Vallitalea okinawensis]
MKKIFLVGTLFCIICSAGCGVKNDNGKIQDEMQVLVDIDTSNKSHQEIAVTENLIEGKSNVEMLSSVENTLSFIPEGWSIAKNNMGELAEVEGDLNKDGINDKAIVIQNNAIEDHAQDRDLLIAFGNSDGTYELSIRADKAILLSNEGGTFGDPFEGISIDRGSILLKFFGGSSEKWYYRFRFRFEDNGWYLIGATEGGLINVNGNMEDINEDYNLLTGDYIINELEDGKLVTKKGKMDTKELIDLENFSLELYEKEY